MEITDALLRADEIEKLLSNFRVCGRPNYQNKPCGLRTYTGLPCKHHVTDADREAQALVKMIAGVANDLYRQEQDRSAKYDAQEKTRLREELREAEARAGMRRYNRAEIEALVDRESKEECGRPTKTSWDHRPCTLARENFAPACKWHLEPWEWNMNEVADRALFQGMMWERKRNADAGGPS